MVMVPLLTQSAQTLCTWVFSTPYRLNMLNLALFLLYPHFRRLHTHTHTPVWEMNVPGVFWISPWSGSELETAYIRMSPWTSRALLSYNCMSGGNESSLTTFPKTWNCSPSTRSYPTDRTRYNVVFKAALRLSSLKESFSFFPVKLEISGNW